jgi:acetyl esterase/lipase
LAELDDDPDAFAKALLRLRRTDRRRPPRSVRTQWDVADVPVSGFDMFVMSPRHADPSASVILYLHGGGYLLGPFGTEWSAMRKIAAGAGSDFAMLMYPRAPEHPATTTLEVACAAYDELTMRYPSRQVVLAGTSAGGGLALALMAQLRDDGGPVPRCAVLVSPGVDMPLRDDASPYEDADALLSIAHVRSAGSLGVDHPTVSPAFGELAGLPPLYVFVGGAELLRPSIEVFARRAKEAGTKVQLIVGENQQHTWPIAPTPGGREA